MNKKQKWTQSGSACSKDKERNSDKVRTGASNITARKEASFSDTTKLMEMVVERNNLKKAYARVVGNKGSAGVDKMTVVELKAHLQKHWQEIRKSLLEGQYKPNPVRGVEIPKPGQKGIRKLGIPTVVDRLIQQAVSQVLVLIFDIDFSDSSYGFREGRGTWMAVKKAQENVRNGKRFVVDIDIEKFFDKVNHDLLMSRIARKVKDKRVLRLIRGFLNAGIMENGVVVARDEGTPQGGPLSPLLSNILLDELDKELERRKLSFCRYADDCNIYVRTKRSGERVMASIKTFLQKRLKLKVNEQKSAVDRPWKRKFLGYSMTFEKNPRLKPAKENIRRFRDKIIEKTRKGRGHNIQRFIQEEVNPLMRGWANYYRLSEVKQVFEELDSWVRRRLRVILWRQWKKPKTRAGKLIQRGIEKERAWKSANNGHGAWWNAGASHMNHALPAILFEKMGLVSLLHQVRC